MERDVLIGLLVVLCARTLAAPDAARREGVAARGLPLPAIDQNARLPEGVELQLTTAASEVVEENVGRIRFFPDGGSTGGRVDLNVNGREYIVNVAWLTGEASLELPDDGA